MAIRNVVTRGYGPGAAISFVVLRGFGDPSAVSAAVTASLTESQIVAGGETIVITLTNDTWVAAGATFNAQRQNILDGITGTTFIASQSVTTVVRTSDTVVTITLEAVPGYTITANETGSVVVPATALDGGNPLNAGSFVVTDDVGGAKGGRVRKKSRPRYVVEVDGKFFEVPNIAAAESVLQKVRDNVSEAALRDVQTEIVPKPPRIKIKTLRGAPTSSKVLQKAVRQTQQAVTRAYSRQAEKIKQARARDMEIATLLQRKIQREEEDELLLLLSL